ncbi:hypothetical protein DFH09DRAFT_1508727, partial [Mycena vulgaris]
MFAAETGHRGLLAEMRRMAGMAGTLRRGARTGCATEDTTAASRPRWRSESASALCARMWGVRGGSVGKGRARSELGGARACSPEGVDVQSRVRVGRGRRMSSSRHPVPWSRLKGGAEHVDVYSRSEGATTHLWVPAGDAVNGAPPFPFHFCDLGGAGWACALHSIDIYAARGLERSAYRVSRTRGLVSALALGLHVIFRFLGSLPS